jgi:hypothetical protein
MRIPSVPMHIASVLMLTASVSIHMVVSVRTVNL